MRLLFSLTYYTPYISGLTLHAQMIAEALAQRGHTVTVICMRHDTRLSQVENLNEVKVVRANTLLRVSKGYFSVDWIIKSILAVWKNDVMIVHLPQFEGIIPALLSRLLGKKVVTFYHCDVVLPKSFFNTFIQSCLIVSNLVTLLLSTTVLHSTEDFARHSKLLKHFTKKLKYVYPPIKKYEVDKRIQKLLLNKINDGSSFKIGIVARLAAEKGVEYLLEAIPFIESRIKNYELRIKKILKFKIVIAGPMEPVGEESYKIKIKQLIEKYKQYILLLGTLREEEMGAFYSVLDLLVLPSVNPTESFGTVQVEAMMCGTPVVVSDLPGVRVPVIKTGMGKIFPAKNSEKLAGAIVEVLENKKKYIRNPQKIAQEFSFNTTVDVYEKSVKNTTASLQYFLKQYLKERPLFLSLMRVKEAQLYQKYLPLKHPILDFGCGDGFFAKVAFGINDKSTKLIEVGLDIPDSRIHEAVRQNVYGKIVTYDGVTFPYPKNYFATVISNCVLEHVEELGKVLSEIYRVLTPGGIFLATVATNLWEEYLLGNLILGDIYKKLMRKKQAHRNLLSYRQWQNIFIKNGFHIRQEVGYLDQNVVRFIDLSHYLSISSLFSYKLFGRWVLWQDKLFIFPIDLLAKMISTSIDPDKSACIFFALKKIDI